MAQPPKLRNVPMEDFKDAPEWFQRYLQVLNPFLADVTDSLNGNLTSVNFKRQDEPPFILKTEATVADTFSEGKLKIKNRLGVTPTVVTLAQCEPLDGDSPTPGLPLWQYLQNGLIQIDNIPGLNASKSYRLSFRVE